AGAKKRLVHYVPGIAGPIVAFSLARFLVVTPSGESNHPSVRPGDLSPVINTIHPNAQRDDPKLSRDSEKQL
ncbi:MAG: hypothetical protein ACFCD0_19910, partial [Gemmataceae bacterium]